MMLTALLLFTSFQRRKSTHNNNTTNTTKIHRTYQQSHTAKYNAMHQSQTLWQQVFYCPCCGRQEQAILLHSFLHGRMAQFLPTTKMGKRDERSTKASLNICTCIKFNTSFSIRVNCLSWRCSLSNSCWSPSQLVP